MKSLTRTIKCDFFNFLLLWKTWKWWDNWVEGRLRWNAVLVENLNLILKHAQSGLLCLLWGNHGQIKITRCIRIRGNVRKNGGLKRNMTRRERWQHQWGGIVIQGLSFPVVLLSQNFLALSFFLIIKNFIVVVVHTEKECRGPRKFTRLSTNWAWPHCYQRSCRKKSRIWGTRRRIGQWLG